MAGPPSAPWAVTVALASGRAVELQLREDRQGTSAVRALASRAFGVRVTALVTQDGRRLLEGAALPGLGLGDGAALTAVVEPVVVHSSQHGVVFLAVVAGRFLASWGFDGAGGDSSSVMAELEGAVIEKVCTTSGAVAVLNADGRVVTWGFSDHGGNSKGVQAELQEGVREICAAEHAFAAVKEDGRVVTWGRRAHGGSIEAVGKSLQGVRSVSATDRAFAALRLDGTVVTWGHDQHGADSSAAEPYLRDVRQVVSNHFAFAALTGGGDMVGWARPGEKAWREEGVLQVCLNAAAVAVLQADGAVKTRLFRGADEEAWAAPAEAQSGVQRIYAARSGGFAAVTHAGGVVSWGKTRALGWGVLSWDFRVESGVEGVYCTPAAFAALLSGGKVVAWGNPAFGGDCSRVQAELESGVVHVASNACAFAAVKASGEVVTWGGADQGGDSSRVAALLRPLSA